MEATVPLSNEVMSENSIGNVMMPMDPVARLAASVSGILGARIVGVEQRSDRDDNAFMVLPRP